MFTIYDADYARRRRRFAATAVIFALFMPFLYY